MTPNQQIQYLNKTVKCTLRPSPIHGIGVFALRDIKKGENLEVYGELVDEYDIPEELFHKLRPEVRNLILDRWPQPQPFMHPNAEVRLISFMNHSERPNSSFGKAVRDIKAGEEITEDYDTGNLSNLQKQHYYFLWRNQLMSLALRVSVSTKWLTVSVCIVVIRMF